MKDSFAICIKSLLAHEGMYSNHPDDPGGPTMRGVTQARYDGYRKVKGLPLQSVKFLSEKEYLEIYKKYYWDAARCDDLPLGIDYAVFDGAVNSGPGQAVKWLQRALKIKAQIDGQVGTVTIAALEEQHADEDAAGDRIIDAMCDQRLAFMRSLKNWPSFKNGWTTRVREVRTIAKGMNNHSNPVTLVATQMGAEETGKALASQTKVTETPEGATATKEISLGSGGIVAYVLSKFDTVTDGLSTLSGMPPATAKMLIEGVLLLAVVALMGYGVFSIFNVLHRRKKGEEQEAQ